MSDIVMGTALWVSGFLAGIIVGVVVAQQQIIHKYRRDPAKVLAWLGKWSNRNA